MKKNLFIIIICAFVIIVIWGFVRFVIGGPEDNWICKDGQWIKHGNPKAQKPEKPCGETRDIVIDTPKPKDTVSSPIEIKGKARGFWYFEASFPIHLFDENDNEVATIIAQAQSDWMTSDFVEFKANLEFVPPDGERGTLVFEKDNPSGLPENADRLSIPIRFAKVETMILKAFFNNSGLDPEFSCNKVFPIERKIPKTEGVARAVLGELLKGVTDEEKAQGFFTSINPNVKIQKITIENNTAKVDFDEQLEF